jgi:carbamoyltransferase
MTQRCGLKPNEEEYILMGMAAYGDPNRLKADIYNDFFKKIDGPNIKFKRNLHKGCPDWRLDLLRQQDVYDIAAATQQIYTELLQGISTWVRSRLPSKNLIVMGGCALNCVANSEVTGDWDNVWIMPNPGDAGSSLGAAAALYGKHIKWEGPYLGHDLGGAYPVEKILKGLKEEKIVAVASGRAEYGPRAFGNRSILADPRDPEIKNRVNKIKERQEFRPFAPVVLEHLADKWFEMPTTSIPYMQYAVKCKRPKDIPSVVHVDGTSRVQTVNEKQHPGLYRVLNKFYLETGVPILLNTSLNIKGQPLLNDETDIVNWENKYNSKIIK